ncbi:MAG: hypothetical protein ACRDK9_05105 [Solirubrobacterales bacterium]
MTENDPAPNQTRWLAHSEPAATISPPRALRSALVSAIARRRQRVRQRLALVAGTSGAAVVVALAGGVFSQGPSAALAIDTNAGQWVEVRILDGDAGAQEMTRELQDAGIDAEVRLLPARSELVGRWMGIQQIEPPAPAPGDQNAPAPRLDIDEGFIRGDLLAIRRDAVHKLADGRWVLYVGRAPQENEQPQEVNSVYGPRPGSP